MKNKLKNSVGKHFEQIITTTAAENRLYKKIRIEMGVNRLSASDKKQISQHINEICRIKNMRRKYRPHIFKKQSYKILQQENWREHFPCEIHFEIGDLDITHNINRYWVGSNRWATEDRSLTLTMPTTKKLLFVGGVPTIVEKYRNEKTRPASYACHWLQRGRGYHYKIVEGFIINNDYHVQKTKTISDISTATTAISKSRSKNKILLAKKSKRKLDSLWVSRRDAIAVNCCKIGVDTFLRQNKLTAYAAVRADILSSYKQHNTASFVDKTISACRRRYATV